MNHQTQVLSRLEVAQCEPWQSCGKPHEAWPDVSHSLRRFALEAVEESCECLGFRVQSLGLRVQGLAFRGVSAIKQGLSPPNDDEPDTSLCEGVR